MAVTITATPEPANVPPRMRLDLNTGNAANSFASIEVRRDGRLLRSQPPSGSNLSVAYDYDAPFGTAATYAATGSYYSNTATAEWTESWASLAAWTGDTASYTVSASHARTTVSNKSIRRTTVSDVSRISVGGSPELVYLDMLDVGGSVLASLRYTTNKVYLYSGLASKVLTFASGAATISIYGGVVTVTMSSDGRAMTLPMSGAVRGVQVRSQNDISTFSLVAKIGAISVTPPQTLVDFAATDTDTLTATQAWLVHPVNPNLSLPISSTEGVNGLYVTADSGESISYEEQRELFSPLGRRRHVAVSYGQRRVGDWSLVLCAPSITDRDNVLALLVDQVPLLLRVPASFEWDLPDDWYSVGTVTDARTPGIARIVRTLTLPLTPVDEPVLTQGAQWTWGDVLANYATNADVLNAFTTNLDLLVGTP